jgi:hypothetical protein
MHVFLVRSEERQNCQNYRPIQFYQLLVKSLRVLFSTNCMNFEMRTPCSLGINLVAAQRIRPCMSTFIQLCDPWYTSMDNGDLTVA